MRAGLKWVRGASLHGHTLVPDMPGQLTSDHGWNLPADAPMLAPVVARLKDHGIRTSLFVDYDGSAIAHARDTGADRAELYTEPYAAHFDAPAGPAVLRGFGAAAAAAQASGLGVNAGHDLNLDNLAQFLAIPGIAEVSIGHALVVESIEYGIAEVMARYLAVVARQAVREDWTAQTAAAPCRPLPFPQAGGNWDLCDPAAIYQDAG